MSAKKRKMLVIEDDKALQTTLLRLLEENQLEVIVADNGQEGLDKLRSYKDVDLILLDMKMPVKDGATFRQEQLADPEIAEIPVILLTAHYHHKENQDLKAYEFLRKPIAVEDLMNIVNGFFILTGKKPPSKT